MEALAQAGSIWWPLLLSTFAGLSTSIGGWIAINLSPNEATLAFLLGSAIGVMSTVSIAELWIHKAVEHSNWFGVTSALVAGAVVFAILDPLLPKPVEPQRLIPDRDGPHEDEPMMLQVHLDAQPQVTVATSIKRQSFAPRSASSKSAAADSLPPAARLSNSGSGSSSTSSPRCTVVVASGATAGVSSSNNGSTSISGKLAAAAAPGSGSLSVSGLHLLQGSSPYQQAGCKGLDVCNSSDVNGLQQQQHTVSLPEGCCSQGSSGAGGGSGAGGSSSSSIQAQLQLLRAHHAGLMRLGLLMALTMTLHNMPEGFAVAFSAFTSVGPMMCGAIALHNIPEGLVIAAPIYAATGSKLRALTVTTLSGLSEPLGALIALFLFRPFVSSVERLDFVLAFVGGIMLAVCGLELWPEGRKCHQDGRMMQGIALGAVLMAWTLYAGV